MQTTDKKWMQQISSFKKNISIQKVMLPSNCVIVFDIKLMIKIQVNISLPEPYCNVG